MVAETKISPSRWQDKHQNNSEFLPRYFSLKQAFYALNRNAIYSQFSSKISLLIALRGVSPRSTFPLEAATCHIQINYFWTAQKQNALEEK